MPATKAIWLVEIRVKDWIHVPEGQSRTFGYQEILAHSEIQARHDGFDEFLRRCEFEPVTRQRFQASKLSRTDLCAPDAVQLDD